MQTVYIGCDHRGFQLKEFLKEEIRAKGIEVIDVGNTVYDADDDYPDFALPLAEKVVANKAKGILICGSGIGVSLAANKINGARAAVVRTEKEARATREHNDANILCLGADSTNQTEAMDLFNTFFNTLFSSEEKHLRRIQKIIKYETSRSI